MKAKEEYVFEYCRKEPGRETIVWGPEKAVRRVMKLDGIEFCSIPKGVHVVKREEGSFKRDYTEVFNDVEDEVFFYRKLNEHLRCHYIPASIGEAYYGFEANDSYVFLETLKADRNVIYSYLGHKIEYCITNCIEIPVSLFDDFFYSSKIYDIYNNTYNYTCDDISHENNDIKHEAVVLERVSKELNDIVCVINKLSWNIAHIRKELE